MSSEVAVEMHGGRWKRYPEYKDSGVEWLGEVPEHWDVTKLNHLSHKIGDGIHATPIYVDESNYRFINGNNLVNGSISRINSTRCVSKEEYETHKVNLDDNTILLSINGTIGNVAFYNNELVILGKSAAYIVCKKELSRRFLFYWLLSEIIHIFYALEVTGTTIYNLSLDSVRNMPILLPSFSEQRAIAAFLDRETGRIDTLIEKKGRQVELLQEKRAVLISHAVTKGLDPDVKMKDSGVEWLGDVPEGWKLRKLKHVAKINLSNVDKKTKEDEDSVKLCNYVDVYKNDYINSDINFMEATASPNQIDKFALREGDVLITKDSESWEDIAVPAYIPTDLEDVICGYHLAHIRPDHVVVNGEYIFRSFSAICLNYQFKVEANGITRFGIGKYPIDNSLFLVPPINEQKSIAAFLDRETGCIDTLTAKLSESISKLREYRSALISAAVTGKIDVREDLVS